MATTLPSDYKDAPSFIKNGIKDKVLEKYDVNLSVIPTDMAFENPEILKFLRKEYRRYRRHWRRLDIRQQKQRQQINNNTQQILDCDLPW